MSDRVDPPPEPAVMLPVDGELWSFADLRGKGVSLDEFFGPAARFNDEPFFYPCPFEIENDVPQADIAKWQVERYEAGEAWCKARSDEARNKAYAEWQSSIDADRSKAMDRLRLDQEDSRQLFLPESELLDDSLPEQLRSAGLKIWWARHHFGLLREHIIAYEESQPAGLDIRENQPEGEEQRYVVHVDPVPPEVPLTVGDLLGCLRIALDHVAWGLVPEPNREVVRPDNGRAFSEQIAVGFPFLFEDPDKDTSGARALNKKTIDQAWISDPDAVDLLKYRQPYLGPEPTDTHPREWLELLAQRDKHRVMTPIAVAVTGGVVHGGSAISVASGGNFVLQDGDVFEQGVDAIPIVNPGAQVRFAIDVRFEEIANFRAERSTSFFGGEVLGHVPRETTAEIVLGRIINLLEDTFVEAKKYEHLFTNADAAGPVHIPSTLHKRGPSNPRGFPPGRPES